MKKILNEFIIYENYAELVITRANGTKIHTQIDIDKIDLVKSKHWCYNNTGYIRSTAKEKYIPLHRFLLNAKEGLVVLAEEQTAGRAPAVALYYLAHLGKQRHGYPLRCLASAVDYRVA